MREHGRKFAAERTLSSPSDLATFRRRADESTHVRPDMPDQESRLPAGQSRVKTGERRVSLLLPYPSRRQAKACR